MEGMEDTVVIEKRVVSAIFFLIAAASLWAEGGGGVFWGRQRYHSEFANRDIAFCYSGGYGYGVKSGGTRVGGFGMGIHDESNAADLTGGVGGIITGQQAALGPIMLSMNALLGVGGIRADFGQPASYFAYFGELDAELGVRVVEWMQISLYGGMTLFGNLAPGDPVTDSVVYSPVVGMRLTWGSF